MTVVGTLSGTISFTYNVSNINISPTQEIAIPRNRYVYFGYGSWTSASNYTYTPVDGAYEANTGTTSKKIKYNTYGSLSLVAWGNYETGASAYPTFYQFAISSGSVNESVPNGQNLTWYITFSGISRTNSSSIITDASCITIAIVFTVNNPPYQSYSYHVYFYDTSTQILDYEIQVSSRSAWTYLPISRDIPNAKNATSLGYVKPGKIGIGWDTSTTATTVVYGGEGTGDLYIPENTIPYTNGLRLYAVWKDGIGLKIVMNVSGTEITTKDVVDIKMVVGFDGTTPQLVSIIGAEVKQSV